MNLIVTLTQDEPPVIEIEQVQTPDEIIEEETEIEEFEEESDGVKPL